MMQAAEDRRGDDATILGRFDIPRHGSIPLQREMWPNEIVVLNVPGKNSPEMAFTQDNHVIQTLSACRVNYAFDVWILPRRPGRDERLLDPQVLDPVPEVLAVDRIAIPEQESWSLVVRKHLNNLLSSPLSGQVGCRIEVDQATSMAENQEYIQHAKCDGCNGEEIHGGDLVGVVLQKRSPSLGRRLGISDHVLTHRGFGHIVVQQEQLGEDSRGAPRRVFAAHVADKCADLTVNLGSAWGLPGLPSPVEAKSHAMPADDSLGLNDEQGRTPSASKLRQ